MKAVRLSLVIMAAALITISLSGGAYAFHRGGVAECSGCHSMHSSGGSHLLAASDASSTCLGCHEHAGATGPGSYYVSTPDTELGSGIAPKQRGPGGDFAWLKKSYAWTAHGEVDAEPGESHGHSITAVDKGYNGVTGQAPGGTFDASKLGCQSCHDPHGKGRRDSSGNYASTGAAIYSSGSTGGVPAAGLAVGLYRLLAWPGYLGAPGANYSSWPVAVSPSNYNQTEATNMVRIAYSANGTNTWGKWCGTCHTSIANATGLGGHPAHKIDQTLGQTYATNYNNYVKSGDMSGTFGGSTPGPYTSLVPFAEDATLTVLTGHAKNDNTQLGGPGTSDQVMCLSCHRAHASGWKHALRWNNETSFIVSNAVYPAEMGRTAPETQAAYYDRPASVFAAYQRSLCNKCHAKD
jgi:predicted CXXCH cytochrome family protein